MGAVGDLVVRLLGDTKQLDDSIRKSEKNLRKFGESAAKIGRKLTTFVTLPILGMGVAFLKVAADAEETNSKFDAVFKNQAESVREWARAYSDSTGRSTIKNIEFLASVQDLFVPLGVARDEATTLSKSVVTLATDISSFNNQPTDRVLLDIQSALVGSVITMRKYGVVLNEANLNQELLNMGIAGGGKEATAAEKALARLNIIMASTTDAQGDAVRTADSFTNRFIALKSSVIDLAETFGNLMLPVVQKLVESITKGVRAFRDMNEGHQKLLLTVLALAAAIGPLIFIVGKLITGFLALRSAILVASTALNITPWGLVAIGVGLLATGIITLIAATKDQEEAQAELNEEIVEANEVLAKNVELTTDAFLSRQVLANVSKTLAITQKINAIEERLLNERLTLGIFKTRELKEEIVKLKEERDNLIAGFDPLERGIKKETVVVEEETEEIEQQAIVISNLWNWKQRWIQILREAAGGEREGIEIVKDGNKWKQAQIDLLGELIFKQRIIAEEGKEANKRFWAPYIALLERAAAAIGKQGRVLRDASVWVKKYGKSNEEAAEGVEVLIDVNQVLRDSTMSIVDSISQVWSNLHQQRMDEIDAELQAQLDSLDVQLQAALEAAGLADETLQDRLDAVIAELAAETDATKMAALEDEKIELERQIARKEIIDEYDALAVEARDVADAEKRKLAHDEAIRNQAFALFDIAINTAVAISKLLTNPIAAIAAGIAGAAQAALVLSQPIPALAQGGIITEPTVILAGEAGPEKIVPLGAEPMRVTVNLGSNVLFDEITQGTRDRNILIDQGAIA